MRILVVSDSHDQQDLLQKALEEGYKEKVQAIVHCGDLVSPDLLTLLYESGLPVVYAMGNNEGEEEKLQMLADEYEIPMTTGALECNLGQFLCAVTHYPALARKIADTGKYHAVFFGHSHKREHILLANGTLLVNPGTIAGWRQDASCAVVDLEHKTVEYKYLSRYEKYFHI